MGDSGGAGAGAFWADQRLVLEQQHSLGSPVVSVSLRGQDTLETTAELTAHQKASVNSQPLVSHGPEWKPLVSRDSESAEAGTCLHLWPCLSWPASPKMPGQRAQCFLSPAWALGPTPHPPPPSCPTLARQAHAPLSFSLSLFSVILIPLPHWG